MTHSQTPAGTAPLVSKRSHPVTLRPGRDAVGEGPSRQASCPTAPLKAVVERLVTPQRFEQHASGFTSLQFAVVGYPSAFMLRPVVPVMPQFHAPLLAQLEWSRWPVVVRL